MLAPTPEFRRPLTQGAADVIAEAELASHGSARGRPLRVKLGLDPTASDLHLGHAVVLRTLRRFQDAGHVAVLIVGDFTAHGRRPVRSLGHPAARCRRSRSTRRPTTYVEQVTQVLDPDPARLEVRRNSEWLAAMGIEDVLQARRAHDGRPDARAQRLRRALRRGRADLDQSSSCTRCSRAGTR